MALLGLLFALQCLMLQDVFSYPLQGANLLGNLGLNQGLNQLNPGLNALNPGLNGLNPGLAGLNGLNAGLTGLNPGLNGLNPGLSGLNAGLNPALNLGNLAANVNSQTVLTGTVSQTVAPSYIPGWELTAAQAPLVTEIVPSLQFGEISLDGDLPIGGSIKISGTFPVYGYVGVDGTVPSYGTAYIDTGNGLIDFCSC